MCVSGISTKFTKVTVLKGNPCQNMGECWECNEITKSCFKPIGTPCINTGSMCSNDTCDGRGRCASAPMNGAHCDDGNILTINDECAGTTCVGILENCETEDDCDDMNPCTVDSCLCGLESCECYHSRVDENTVCDDYIWCNGKDYCCAAGFCDIHQDAPCAIHTDECGQYCNETYHTCQAPVGYPCDDNNFCNGNKSTAFIS